MADDKLAEAEKAHDVWYAKTKGYMRDDRTIMGAYEGFLAGWESALKEAALTIEAANELAEAVRTWQAAEMTERLLGADLNAFPTKVLAGAFDRALDHTAVSLDAVRSAADHFLSLRAIAVSLTIKQR